MPRASPSWSASIYTSGAGSFSPFRQEPIAAIPRPPTAPIDGNGWKSGGPRDGIEAAAEILERFGIRSIFVSAFSDPTTRARADRANPIAWLAKQHALRGKPAEALHRSVSAVSVGVIGGEPRLDLCYEEDVVADVDMNVVCTGAGDFVDGFFFQQLSKVHPRFRTPAFAVLAGSAWAILLAATGTFEQLLTYVVFTGWLFYALGAASIFVYRRRASDRELPYRVPGYPWTPLLFIVAAAALVINTIATQFGRAAIGLGMVLLGTPAYFVWRSRSKSVSDSR